MKEFFFVGRKLFHSYFFLCVCVGSELLYSNCSLYCLTYIISFMKGAAFIRRAPLSNSFGYWIPDYPHVININYLIVRIFFSNYCFKMIHFLLYYLSMLMDNTIWHDISHFLPFFVLFSTYIFTDHWLILFQGHQIVLIISFIYIYISMPADNVT